MSSSRTEPGSVAARSGGAATLVDVTMPQMGVSVAEGTVVAWRVEVGDPIAADETICDISTDKIDTEVPAPVSGVVTEILVSVDTTVDVGTVLARISTGGGSDQTVADAPSTQEMEAAADEPAAVSPDTTAPDPTKAQATASAPVHQDNGATPSDGSSARRYSPVVQRIASEHGVDLDQVPGTGRGGRVRKQDVLTFIESSPKEEAPLHIESPYRPDPVPTTAGSGSGEAVVSTGADLSRMRRQIGEHMKRSLDTTATCTTWIEVDMTRVETARARLGVTALAFVSRAAIDALREYPQLNAWLEGEKYTQHQGVNLGIAVSLGEDGLIVPVIHNAHELSVEGLAARIKDLARRARSRQLVPDEVRGGTFTITNPGQFGSIMATPIINLPQVGILDFEATVKRPVVVTDADGNDSIAIRAMTILGLSWDHRALDGALSAQFLAAVKRHLEGVVTP
ncbi:MAG TPA: dihydrolipoamide acetyltransferase family protein [Solirubrobacteraceae bacterium]|nr:dihydrolipoamide acetyltransferase family protein [Solirubrobacteraceae bacterium]